MLRISDVASVALGPASRRGVLEKDGNEAVGGVVLMRHGENPLRVTRLSIKERTGATPHDFDVTATVSLVRSLKNKEPEERKAVPVEQPPADAAESNT